MTDGERLTRLEEGHTHLQRHVAEQDKVMLELAKDLERLRREVARLHARLEAPGDASKDDAPVDERPPHY